MLLSSILVSVNSLMAVNYYSVKSGNRDIDKSLYTESLSKFCAGDFGDNINKFNSDYSCSNKNVELDYFNATFLNEGIMIKWQSYSNNKDLKFELQKSYDGIYFEKLAIIENDCTSEDNYYTFLDTELKLNSEIVYYRLKQIDNADRVNYSDIIYLATTNDIGFND